MAPDGSYSLLVVEDDLAARNIIVQMIQVKFRGCTVYTADNGKEGLDLFKQNRPRVVVTDINMPVMDGIEMAQEIRAVDPDAAFVVLTAYGDESFERTFSEIGFCSFLSKPVDFKKLFISIEKCFEHTQGGRPPNRPPS